MKKFYLNLEQYVSKKVILFWTFFILFTFGNSIFAQTTVDFTTPGSATWTVPCGVTSLTVEAWGGGGAGGGAMINPSGGSGGGGGGYSTYTVIVTSGQIINYTVGQGGVGGSGNGGDGSLTTILALTANGGIGGFQDNGTAGLGGTASGGTTNTSGDSGVTGLTTAGGAGGNSANGGNGGVTKLLEGNGNNGTSPGGGGGGGLLLSGAGPSLGGNGADGQIRITYTQPVVNAPTPVTPSSAVSICSGKSTNLNATSDGNTINWYTVPTGGTSIGSSASAANFSVSPTADTTYYAEAVSPAGCVSATRTATVLVTVNPLPATASLVTPNVPTNICNGSSINLNATSAGNTIYWFTVPTGGGNLGTSASAANFLIAPTNNTTTTYYADPRTPAGCFSATRTATGTITASAPPVINTQPVSPAQICEGSGTRTITITATGVNTYQWRRNGVDLTNNATFSGVTTVTLTITNPATADSGTYTVMLNGSTCGLVSNNATLTVNALPTPPAVTPNGAAVVACTTTGNTPLNATSAGNTIYWYTVATAGTSVGSSASGANFLVSAPTATVYYAESRNATTGCVSSSRTATASVTSNVLPVITAQPSTPAAACAGVGTVTISVGATGVTTYQWRKNGSPLSNVAPYSGVTTATLTITNPPIGDNGATFDVVLNNATCPVTSNTITLTVNAIPSAPTSVTPSTPSTICGTANITLNATSAGNTIYWYTVATGGTSIGNSASGVNLSASPTGTVTYYAEARTAVGCSSLTRTATATMTINPTPVVTVEFTENQNDKTYSIAACGHIAASENDIDVASGNPAGENATTFGPTATGQWQVSYDNQATWVNAPGPTSTAPQYLFDPAYSIFETTPGTYYFRLILTVNGCPGTSDVITLTTNGNPTLTPGSIAADQSSCPTPYNPIAFTQTAGPSVATPISGYNFSYQWQSSTDNVNFTSIAGATASTYDSPNISVTTYFRRYAIYGSAGGGCSAVSNTITVTVGSLAPPTVGTITQPNCTTATGSVVLSGLPASGTWTLTRSGTSSQTTTGTGASTTISGLAEGTYNFTVSQSTCTSPATANVVINTAPVVPAAPTASVTPQTTCTTPTGTIVITLPAPAANVTYTVTGTAPVVAAVTQAGNTFANLTPGTYSITTTNTTSGCTSTAISLTVNPVPANPPTPTASVTVQPTCSVTTGTIVVSAPLPAANVTYTVTGTSPVVAAVTQTGNTFANLSSGTYSVTRTNTTTGCISSAISLTVNAIPANPAAPTASVTVQPNCSVTTGTIVITVPTPAANVTYTVTGTSPVVAAVTQAGATFANLAPGDYSVTTTNTTTGCISSATNLTVNTVPANPAAPTASVTVQPNCSVTTGTIVVTAPAPAANVTYTVTGTSPVVAAVTQAGATFANLAPGDYSVTTTNTTTGCISSATNLTVNTVPANPPLPTASVTPQPTCTVTTGTIVITAPAPAANITYTLTGTSPVVAAVTQAGATFANLNPGAYSVTATNTTTGCISGALGLTVNTIPANPAAPTASVTVQPTCSVATGTIVITVPAPAANVTYTVTGTSPVVAAVTQAGATFANLNPGTYSITTTDTTTGCISSALTGLTINTQPTLPAVPSLTAGTITCNNVAANWTTIPNVTGYRIDVARDNIFTDIIPAYNNLLLGSGAVTENVTGLASGLTFYIRLRAENSCGPSANSNIITITTGSSPTAFTTALVQPNCVTATGQITINESVVDPSDQYSFDDGVTYQASNVKGLLAAGTYKLRVKNTNGCETLPSTVVLNAATVTTYTGTWSNGTPDVLKKAIFASNYTFTGDIQACSCEVNTGVTVTVNPGFSLVLENGIDILGTGSIIFENNSSLIQTNNVVNTGNITYKRNTTPVGKFDYTYWSSPVSPQTLLNVSPTTLFDKYLSWDAVAGTWKVEATSTVMGKGIGYIIRGPQGNATPAVHTASFIGVPNNGPISYSIANSGLSYLIGNPYPSALDADEFLGANPALDGTIRFWTHNTPVTNLKYNGNDYASYNAVGGTGTAAANTGVNNSIPTGKIAAGQAFFATSNAAGTITFENTMRVGPGGAILNNSQFFKGPKPKTSSALKKHRVWLNLSNVDGAFKQLLVGYVTNATNGLDRLFDGQTMNANKYVDFYSINDSKKLSIQGRALPFDIMDQVPLGFKATIEGTFSISIDQVDGVLVTLPIFLEDKLTGTIVNLKNGAYSFSTAIGTFDDRFILRYMNSSIKISDYTNAFDEINKKVLVSVKNHQIKINSFDQTIDNVTIYDLSRRKLYEKGNINNNEFNVPDFSSTNQFLMVQIRLKNGKIVTDKIVY
jgi:hypothetical protein